MKFFLCIFFTFIPLVFGGVTSRCVRGGTGSILRDEICGGHIIAEWECLILGCCFEQGTCFYGGQKLGYANAGRAGDTKYADASFQTWQHDKNHGDLFYFKSALKEDSSDHTKWEVGFINHKNGVNNFQIDNKIGVLGGDAIFGGYKSTGAMARILAVKGTLHTEPVDINYGLNFDSGIMVDNGVEVKVAGIGGKIGADGIEACFIVCLGFNWQIFHEEIV